MAPTLAEEPPRHRRLADGLSKVAAVLCLAGFVLAVFNILGWAERTSISGFGDLEKRAPEHDRSIASQPPQPPQIGLFSAGAGGYRSFRIPALVSRPCGTGAGRTCLHVFAEGRWLSASDSGPIDIVTRRSTDGGRSWTPIETAVSWGDISTTVGNPAPVWDGEMGSANGSLLLLFTVNNTWPFVTKLEPTGWSTPRNLSLETKLPGWGWMATGPGHGIRLLGPVGGSVGARASVYFPGRLVVPVDHMLSAADVSLSVKLRLPAGVPPGDGRARPRATVRFVTVNAQHPTDRYVFFFFFCWVCI
ncbi:Sialidase [Pavlovales sp. CCMP2436]|nr:Sialidase [Pavlovales sp. CCMP2436]